MATLPVVRSEGSAAKSPPAMPFTRRVSGLAANLGSGASACSPMTGSLALRSTGTAAAALAVWATPGIESILNTGPVLVIRRSRQRVLPALKRSALARSIRCGKSTAHSWGGR